jgi:16S rRNA (cytosine967-C5)-methyltransferase
MPDFPVRHDTGWPAPALPGGRIFPAQLQLAVALLERIESEGLPADRSIQRELASRRKMGRRDRERLRELVLFVLRQRRVIDHLLGESRPTMGRRLGTALLLAGRLDPVLADAAGLDEGALENARAGMASAFDALPAAVRFNLSADNAARWARLDPPDPEALARALAARAPVDLHVNPRRGDAPALRGELAEAGIEARPIPGLAHGLRLDRPTRLTRLESFRHGGFEVQDAGSQWVVQSVAARPGDRVLDLCAGAGGKTLGLLDETGGRIEATACDRDAERLERLRERLRRHGDDDRVRLDVLDATRPLPAALGDFDRVLIDAPCSGSGTWRRHPELRWADIDWADLARRQRALLEHGAEAVCPGGQLIYATCSLWREENEDIVEGFLADHPGWKTIRRALPALAEDAFTPEGWIRLRPDRHGCDGFFIAGLRAPNP